MLRLGEGGGGGTRGSGVEDSSEKMSKETENRDVAGEGGGG